MPNKIFEARRAIDESRILNTLSAYSPEIVSTIFVGLDVEGSDIDIICCHQDSHTFAADFQLAFSIHDKYQLEIHENYILGHFHQNGFLFEIYASPTPVHSQPAYRHFQIMKRLVNIGGEQLQSRIRELKLSGLKTEPAICKLLGLDGEPYTSVLKLEQQSDDELVTLIKKRL